MNSDALRVAFFPDAYHEIDGVANTSRQFEAFAIRHNLPFLTILGGTKDSVEAIGSVTRVERKRGPVSFALDKKHDFDLAFLRHYAAVQDEVRKFAPDVLHITGPSDVGIMGTILAHRLHIPLAASWHTNVHEYAERRASTLLSWLPTRSLKKAGGAIRRSSLAATLRFYRIAQMLFAPNQELIDLIEGGTSKACHLMQRGVETELFDPQRRERSDDAFVIGYVGRLTVEKNIRSLVELEAALLNAGMKNFRFSIVGQGAEEEWLRANLRNAEFSGVLRGEALARAYANMDVFAFPSHTDTYGNVVLEALASGVPAVVTDKGGPRFIVRPNETGFVAADLSGFVDVIIDLAGHPEKLAAMRVSARAQAVKASWDKVFESVYASYDCGLSSPSATGKKIRLRPHSAVCL